MKRTFLTLLIVLLTAACTRLGSTPQPAASPTGALRLCAAADLQTSSSSNAATGAIQLGVTLINISKSPCVLVEPPQVALNGKSAPLDVQIIDAAADQTPPAPAGVSIAPGNSVIIILVWRNYCGAALTDGPVIHITITTDQALDVRAGLDAVPRCDAAGAPSTLTVQPYSYPP